MVLSATAPSALATANPNVLANHLMTCKDNEVLTNFVSLTSCDVS